MKRRSFLQSSLAVLGTAAAAQGDAESSARGELYELRCYTLRKAAKRPMLDAYLDKAFIPAAKRARSRC